MSLNRETAVVFWSAVKDEDEEIEVNPIAEDVDGEKEATQEDSDTREQDSEDAKSDGKETSFQAMPVRFEFEFDDRTSSSFVTFCSRVSP